MKRIKVELNSQGYGIYIENDLLKKSAKYISSINPSKKTMILSVAPAFKLYGKMLSKNLKIAGTQVHSVLIPDGEAYKNEKILFFVLKKMAQLGLQKNDCLATLGGGVVGDLGGLAASLYMRGINFIQCPTTFLAQVDASVGGKTAIDFYGIKNLVGTFYQPKLVLIDPTTLKTLDDRQIRTGLAEVIKYGVIKDEKMFSKIEKHLTDILNKKSRILLELISRSCEIKAQIVSEDEKEKGNRVWLNYGHTLGHALESYFKYRYLTHGEAVAYGMWFAALLSARKGLCSAEVAQRQIRLLNKAGLLRRIPTFSPKKVFEKMLLDKKSRDGKVQFVLTRKLGLVTIQKNVPRSVILSVLNQIQVEANTLL